MPSQTREEKEAERGDSLLSIITGFEDRFVACAGPDEMVEKAEEKRA